MPKAKFNYTMQLRFHTSEILENTCIFDSEKVKSYPLQQNKCTITVASNECHQLYDSVKCTRRK